MSGEKNISCSFRYRDPGGRYACRQYRTGGKQAIKNPVDLFEKPTGSKSQSFEVGRLSLTQWTFDVKPKSSHYFSATLSLQYRRYWSDGEYVGPARSSLRFHSRSRCRTSFSDGIWSTHSPHGPVDLAVNEDLAAQLGRWTHDILASYAEEARPSVSLPSSTSITWASWYRTLSTCESSWIANRKATACLSEWANWIHNNRGLLIFRLVVFCLWRNIFFICSGRRPSGKKQTNWKVSRQKCFANVCFIAPCTS